MGAGVPCNGLKFNPGEGSNTLSRFKKKDMRCADLSYTFVAYSLCLTRLNKYVLPCLTL